MGVRGIGVKLSFFHGIEPEISPSGGGRKGEESARNLFFHPLNPPPAGDITVQMP